MIDSRKIGLVLIAALVGFAPRAMAQTGGLSPGARLQSPAPPPLTQFKTLTLPTVGGDIDAVLYNGNTLVTSDTVMTTLTGFTVPSTPPFTAKTTYVGVDGQCGFASPNGCVGRQTGGSGDTLTFKGSGSLLTFSNGPDAFKGSDGCPWGADTCLWDTRNFDVTGFVVPGSTSADVEVTSGAAIDGTDCINHEAQAFAVGPSLAWGFGGYVAGGKGLRNQGSGVVTIAGIPPTATVVEADLYWNILNGSDPGGAMNFNGNPIVGTMFQKGGDPCWNNGSWAFRADVTPYVTGNGVYMLSGYPTGSTSGTDPWTTPSPDPKMEGATLIVFFGQQSTPGKVTLGGYIDPATGEIVDGSTLDIQSGPSAGNKATFGGVVQFKAGDTAPSGNFRYIDHGLGEDIKETSYSLLVISDGACGPNTHAAFRFTADENGVPGQEFKVEVDDCAEPGSQPGPDTFSIQKLPAGYLAAGPLEGGNVQIHKQ